MKATALTVENDIRVLTIFDLWGIFVTDTRMGERVDSMWHLWYWRKCIRMTETPCGRMLQLCEGKPKVAECSEGVFTPRESGMCVPYGKLVKLDLRLGVRQRFIQGTESYHIKGKGKKGKRVTEVY